jgi:hypothetical protein
MKIFNNHKVFDDLTKGIFECLLKENIQCEVVDSVDPNYDGLYIMFNLNAFSMHDKLPLNFIAVQMEQTGVDDSRWMRQEYYDMLDKAIEVWDYSKVNIKNFSKKINVIIKHVPIMYMDCIHNKNKLLQKKDIDVLFMGSMNERRKKIIHDLKDNGINVHVAPYNLWGQKRDNMLARSKIVLNIHFYENAILETTRLSYVLSLGECIVVSEKSVDEELDTFYSQFVNFSSESTIVQDCKKILSIDEKTLKRRINIIHSLYSKHEFKVPMDTVKKYKEEENLKSYESVKSYIVPELVPEEGRLVLPSIDDEDLPFVSIATITKNRKKMFELPIRNFYLFDYPKEKLEWVIIDDGNDNLKEFIPNDKRIKYLRYESIDSLCVKRDLAVEQCSHNIIVFMDDDDYYFPCSIYARIMLMKKYQKGCVGCLSCGIYDIINDNSFIMNTKHMFEASMAFTKDFWNERKFGTRDSNYGESYLFTSGRESEIINMPYFFNLIAITHGSNVTEKLRTFEKSGKFDNFFNMWPNNVQLFFLSLLKKNAFT